MQLNIKEIADNANMIINGYAFTREGKWVRVLNLNCVNHAAVILDDKVVETNMDEIESEIVIGYYKQNKHFMEEEDAKVL
jgi:hypothetical protein